MEKKETRKTSQKATKEVKQKEKEENQIQSHKALDLMGVEDTKRITRKRNLSSSSSSSFSSSSSKLSIPLNEKDLSDEKENIPPSDETFQKNEPKSQLNKRVKKIENTLEKINSISDSATASTSKNNKKSTKTTKHKKQDINLLDNDNEDEEVQTLQPDEVNGYKEFNQYSKMGIKKYSDADDDDVFSLELPYYALCGKHKIMAQSGKQFQMRGLKFFRTAKRQYKSNVYEIVSFKTIIPISCLRPLGTWLLRHNYYDKQYVGKI